MLCDLKIRKRGKEMEKMHKATLAEKLGYGLGELPGTMNSILGAVLTMFYTDSAGLAAGMVGWILALTGYVANEVQNSATVFGISFMFAWLPIILLAFVIFSFKFMYHSIKPGRIWLDTDGNRIQAHGGSIITVKDTFYWYGENKEKTTGKDQVWHWGVRCYSSKDLYNWKSEGIIIPPDTLDPASLLHPSAMMDRPHIIYNEKTKKYAAWLKIMGEPPCFPWVYFPT